MSTKRTRKPVTDITQLLSEIDSGSTAASENLLPIVYDELRQLASVRLAKEKPGQTLQATALVHEAYLRLLGNERTAKTEWNSRGHFFGAAAEAMRRILVERARQRNAKKFGGEFEQIQFSEKDFMAQRDPTEILMLDDAINNLSKEDAIAGELVKLRLFAEFSIEDAGKMLGMSRAAAYRQWAFARAWLKDLMANE